MLSIATVRKNSQNTKAMVCLEVSSSHVRLAIVNQTANERSLTLDEVRWRVNSSSLLTESGVAELTEAFQSLTNRHDLRNPSVHITISSELCVSRAAGGDLQHVTNELRGFESRCQRYLCLGHGAKVHASRIDPHRDGYHGMFTAANHHVVSAIETAAHECGFHPVGMEPAVTSVSRLMGYLDDDRENPLLLVNLDSHGVEFSLCHEGRPLIQYRPAPGCPPEQAGDAAQSNMSRLRRNCQRYAGHRAQIRQIFVIGPNDHTAPAVESLTKNGLAKLVVKHAEDSSGSQTLDLTVLDPTALTNVVFDQAENVDGRYVAVIGLASLAWIEQDQLGPDLLASVDRQNSGTWSHWLRKHWLVASILFIATTLQALTFIEKRRVEELTAAQESSPVGQEVINTRLAIGRHRAFELRYISLAERCEQGRFSTFVEQVAQCLPPSVWLTGVEVYVDGSVTFRGRTQNEPAVYQAVEALRRSPVVGSVSLNSTSTPDHYGLVNFELRGSRHLAPEVNSEDN